MSDDNDDIRSLLNGALDGSITADPAPPADLGQDTAAPVIDRPPAEPDKAATDTRPRDEQGRFAPKAGEPDKPRDTLTLKPAAEQQPKPAAQAAPTQQQPAASDQGAPPPIDWKGAAKVDWQRLPKPVQAAIRETYDTLQQASADVAPIKELIDGNRQFLVNEAGSVPEAMRQLMAFARLAVDNPPALIQHIARARGVDLHALVTGQAQATQQQPQDPQAFIAQAVQQQLQPLLAQIRQTEDQRYVSQIDAFAADPAHPYFTDVRSQMSTFLKAGTAKTLQEAYDQATWANPAIRQQLLAKPAEDAARNQAAEADRARLAGRASITGSPVPGATQANGESDGSIRGDLMSALRAQTGAV